MIKNSQTFAPGLYIVATPIGNLGDITLRAMEVLRAADIVACEDTRVTAKLLSRFNIPARTTSYHDHNEEEKLPELLTALQAGKIVALVSDAGTPLISDPGYRLVKEASGQGIKVIPIPGPSSVMAALCASGLPSNRFLFVGFLPPKEVARAKVIADLANTPVTLVFFESNHRLADALEAMHKGFGERDAAVAREITKLHEEFRRGSLSELAAHYAREGEPKGEVVIVIAPSAEKLAAAFDTEAMLRERLETMSVKDAASEVAKITNLPRQELYSKALAIKGTL